MSIKTKIRSIPDFPKKGITFRDVSTLFNDERGMKEIIFLLSDRLKTKEFDAIAGIEARGFVVGASLAFHLGKAFIMIRKPGKLPSKVISKKFDLEYGSDSLEIHSDAVSENQRILIVDDLLATGGTSLAACSLVEELGGVVETLAFIVDLPKLGGSKRIKSFGYNLINLIEFEGG